MPLSYRQLVAEARELIDEISTADLGARPPGLPVVIDCREPDEYGQGVIPGAHLVPRGVLESSLPIIAPDPGAEVVIYCAVGERSALAARALLDMGYTNPRSLAGGFAKWKAEGRQWVVPTGLSTERRSRYSRHLVLPEVGEDGQQRLLDSRVLLIGAGGLGSPVALYLAAAGVGTIGLIDFDSVDVTNLQRQIIHRMDRIGRLKVDSARETIGALNPDVTVLTHSARLTAANAIDLLSGYDVVVDGTDNFPTRYLVNDASLHLRVPVVHGSILRFEGQASVFSPYAGPCYRCLFPAPPPPDLAPSCAEAGVLGVLPGIIGSIQAMEAIKLLLGIGEPLIGRLLTYDALDESFRTFAVPRDPSCPSCADEEHPPALIDYDDGCVPVRSGAPA